MATLAEAHVCSDVAYTADSVEQHHENIAFNMTVQRRDGPYEQRNDGQEPAPAVQHRE